MARRRPRRKRKGAARRSRLAPLGGPAYNGVTVAPGDATQRSADLFAALTRAIDEGSTPSARRDQVVLGLMESLDADRCIIGKVDEGAVTAVCGHGMGIAGSPAYARLPIDRGIVGRTAREARTQRVDDVYQDPDYYAAIALTRSELATPVVRDGRVVAVLNVESNRPAAFSPEDEWVIEAAAAFVATHLAALDLLP
jgi:GAF domain-containing protein